MRFLSLHPLCLLLAACATSGGSSSSVETEDDIPGLENLEITHAHDPNARVPASGGFRVEFLVRPAADERFDAEAARVRLRNTVVAELERKGYREDSSQADFLVGIYAGLGSDPRTKEARENALWTEGSSEPFPHTKGAVIIDILEPKTRRALWRSAAGVELTTELSDEARDRRLAYVVHRLLAPFPPK